jgi:hypothetical protein
MFKEARQSSTEGLFVASNAVDNSLLSLSVTNPQQNPWWELDLQYIHNIGAVVFQSDGCTLAEPCNFEIVLSDFSENIEVKKQLLDDGTTSGHIAFPGGVYARKIRVTLHSENVPRRLALNQFQVFGPLDSAVIQNRPCRSNNSTERLDYGMEIKLVDYEVSDKASALMGEKRNVFFVQYLTDPLSRMFPALYTALMLDSQWAGKSRCLPRHDYATVAVPRRAFHTPVKYLDCAIESTIRFCYHGIVTVLRPDWVSVPDQQAARWQLGKGGF